jgi:hypothetical protein
MSRHVLALRAATFLSLILTAANARAQSPAPHDAPGFGTPLAGGARVDLRTQQEAENVVARGNRERAAVLQACHDTHDTDYLMWIAGAAMIATGVTIAVDAFTTSAPARDQLRLFNQGIGPGLVLGGIGFPFARGIVHDQDPVERACERVEHPARGTQAEALDVELAGHLMHDLGPPASPIIIAFLAGATVLTTGFVILAFGLYQHDADHGATIATNQYRDLVNLSGGVYAGIVTGWFLIPPTPERRAATRYAHGYYNRLVAPSPGPTAMVTMVPLANGGAAVGVGGTF